MSWSLMGFKGCSGLQSAGRDQVFLVALKIALLCSLTCFAKAKVHFSSLVNTHI